MFTERTSVGLDVHARSVAAAAIDGVTGELFQTRLTPSYDHIVINAATGEVLRELTIDITRDYQPLGRPPGPPPHKTPGEPSK